jgi:hypothetical protein
MRFAACSPKKPFKTIGAERALPWKSLSGSRASWLQCQRQRPSPWGLLRGPGRPDTFSIAKSAQVTTIRPGGDCHQRGLTLRAPSVRIPAKDFGGARNVTENAPSALGEDRGAIEPDGLHLTRNGALESAAPRRQRRDRQTKTEPRSRVPRVGAASESANLAAELLAGRRARLRATFALPPVPM